MSNGSQRSLRAWKRAAPWCSTIGVAALLIAPSASARNILMFVIDDSGVDKVSSYAGDYAGYAAAATYLPQTDTIDSLAAAGLRFTRAWANPLCSPTRASFQTGVYPFRHEVGTALGSPAAGLDPTGFTMLADTFSNNLYDTGYFGKWHIGEEAASGAIGTPAVSPFFDTPAPALAGWDRFFGKYSGYIDDYWSWDRVRWIGATATGTTGVETVHATRRTANAALDWINARNGDPFLAVVAFHAPHEATAAGWQDTDVNPARVRSASLACLDPADPSYPCADEARATYQGLMEDVDIAIEDVLSGITDPAVLDDTTILVFGDNGTPPAVSEGAFNAVGRGKGTGYESGVRVPLIIADGATWRTGAAGVITSPGRTVDAAVNTMDSYQTAMNHALLFSVANVDSATLTDCFTNTGIYCGRQPKRFNYTETFRLNGAGTAINSAQIGVSYGYDKMVAHYDAAGACMMQEYYDVSTDPFETAPQAWAGLVRGQRLCQRFRDLHNTTGGASWGFATPGGVIVPFCTPC